MIFGSPSATTSNVQDALARISAPALPWREAPRERDEVRPDAARVDDRVRRNQRLRQLHPGPIAASTRPPLTLRQLPVTVRLAPARAGSAGRGPRVPRATTAARRRPAAASLADTVPAPGAGVHGRSGVVRSTAGRVRRSPATAHHPPASGSVPPPSTAGSVCQPTCASMREM